MQKDKSWNSSNIDSRLPSIIKSDIIYQRIDFIYLT